jgi:hypothetical protein
MTEDLEPIDWTLQQIIAEARRPVVMDAAVRGRLMDAVRAEELPRRRSRILGWLLEPRGVSMPPLATLAAAAGLVGIGVIGGFALDRDGRSTATDQSRAEAAFAQLPDSVAPVVMKFVLLAPQASRVSVVGDFNGWNGSATPAARQPDGTWTTWVPLTPGRHEYSFVIDGTHFVTDPSRPTAPSDEYGNNNSVVVVSGAAS